MLCRLLAQMVVDHFWVSIVQLVLASVSSFWGGSFAVKSWRQGSTMQTLLKHDLPATDHNNTSQAHFSRADSAD
eukprot:4740525-Amphidinium_carterae.1